MDSQQFDRLTMALAAGTSRRWIVRLLAGGGVAAGATIGRRADLEAAPSTCTVGCASLAGPQQAACKKACRECGDDFDRVCWEDGPFDPINFSCCPEGNFCLHGAGLCCVEGSVPCGEDEVTCCPPGSFCNFATGTCMSECPADSGCLGPECSIGCFCVSSVEGEGACVDGLFANCDAPVCTTSADCGGGVCVDASECCGSPGLRVCFPPEAICAIGAGAGDQATPGGWRQ